MWIVNVKWQLLETFMKEWPVVMESGRDCHGKIIIKDDGKRERIR